MPDISERIRQETEDEATEAWKPDHNLAMQCLALEELLCKGMGMFRRIREQDVAWSRKVQSGEADFDSERARHFRGRYERWYVPCDHVLKAVDYYEKQYRVIEGSNDFRKARLLVRQILDMPISEVIESMKLVKTGKYEAI